MSEVLLPSPIQPFGWGLNTPHEGETLNALNAIPAQSSDVYRRQIYVRIGSQYRKVCLFVCLFVSCCPLTFSQIFRALSRLPQHKVCQLLGDCIYEIIRRNLPPPPGSPTFPSQKVAKDFLCAITQPLMALLGAQCDGTKPGNTFAFFTPGGPGTNRESNLKDHLVSAGSQCRQGGLPQFFSNFNFI